MGTLGNYLRDARIARGIDLLDAAQHTRISAQYLKALEEEDFAKLPGEVFVKGFLKNYGKFLHLDESETLKRYEEIQKKSMTASEPAGAMPEAAAEETHHLMSKFPLEAVLWAAGIAVVLVLFFFWAFPTRQQNKEAREATPAPGVSGEFPSLSATTPKPEKLYLEIIALENTWLLIRTDSSPEKKAMLNKGDSLIWSAEERFLLSYGSAGALKLVLNGKELTVDEPKNAVIRDLAIVSSGIVNRKIEAENARPAKRKQKIGVETRTSQSVSAPLQIEKPQPAAGKMNLQATPAQPVTPALPPQKPVQ